MTDRDHDDPRDLVTARWADRGVREDDEAEPELAQVEHVHTADEIPPEVGS